MKWGGLELQGTILPSFTCVHFRLHVIDCCYCMNINCFKRVNFFLSLNQQTNTCTLVIFYLLKLI